MKQYYTATTRGLPLNTLIEKHTTRSYQYYYHVQRPANVEENPRCLFVDAIHVYLRSMIRIRRQNLRSPTLVCYKHDHRMANILCNLVHVFLYICNTYGMFSYMQMTAF